MTKPRSRSDTAGRILLGLAACALLGAAVVGFGPGFRLAPPMPFGQVLTAELGVGEHAVYVSPSDQWRNIECAGEVDGRELGLRTGMVQQGLLFPQRWDDQRSFALRAPGTVTLTCDGPVSDARFTVGPYVGFFSLAAIVLLLGAAFVLTIVGLVLRSMSPRRRPRPEAG
ncbi:MAG: hypothetical protein ACTMIR_10470 [Cellulomonadaceae bacterium]